MNFPLEYQKLLDEHSWFVPDQYNVAEDVCDKHAGDKLAMILVDKNGDDRFVYWAEIQDRANQYANFLVSSGVIVGDRVAVMLPQGVEAAAALISVLKVGAIGVPLSTLWSDDSLTYRITDASAHTLVTDNDGAQRDIRIRNTTVVNIDSSERVNIDRCSTKFSTVLTAPEDPALIYYTSGSTGKPKGVVAPHQGLIGHNEFEYCQDLQEGELSYWMGDWSWGIYKVLGPWRYGAVNVVHSTPEKYDPEGLLKILSRHKVSNIFLNPTGLRLMREKVPDAGKKYPQNFRICCSANEPLGEPERIWFEEQFGVPILENYGMTEAYPMVGNFISVPRKPGSMGLPVPGWEVEILDDEERPVPPGAHGEICLKARTNPQYPLGYWGNATLSQSVFGGEWFHTNDIAYKDKDGYFFYVGRKDDVIKSAGYRISPFEVEQACERHPAVKQAGVIGVSDSIRGQIVKAFIVLLAGISPSEGLSKEISQFVRDEHSKFGYPKIVEFVESLPASQSGKISRGQLRSFESQQQSV